MRHLIGVNLFSFTHPEVDEFKFDKQQYPIQSKSLLPKWCVTGEQNLSETYFYFQFDSNATGYEIDLKEYLLLDIVHIENEINEIFHDIGEESFIERYVNFDILKTLKSQKYRDFRLQMPTTIYLVFDFTPTEDFEDISVKFIGYLDDEKQIKIS